MKKFFVVLMVVIIGVCALFSLTACSENRGEQYYKVSGGYAVKYEVGGDIYNETKWDSSLEKYVPKNAPIKEIYYNSTTRTITLVSDIDIITISVSYDQNVICYKQA